MIITSPGLGNLVSSSRTTWKPSSRRANYYQQLTLLYPLLCGIVINKEVIVDNFQILKMFGTKKLIFECFSSLENSKKTKVGVPSPPYGQVHVRRPQYM